MGRVEKSDGACSQSMASPSTEEIRKRKLFSPPTNGIMTGSAYLGRFEDRTGSDSSDR